MSKKALLRPKPFAGAKRKAAWLAVPSSDSNSKIVLGAMLVPAEQLDNCTIEWVLNYLFYLG